MPNEVFEFLDGKKYVLDGISGVFKYATWRATYPYSKWVESLTHEPDTAGMDTEKYRATRQELGDDWVTDLTASIDRYCDIAMELGYDEKAHIIS